MLQGGSDIINSLLLNFISLNFVSFVTTTSVKLVVMHHRRHLQPDVLLLTLLMHQRHHLQEPNVLLMHHRRHLQPGVLPFVWLPRTILVSCLAYLVLLKLSKNPLPDVLPYTRQEGRLRRHRVSTPIQATVVCMPSRPDRPKCSARPQLFDADLPDVDNVQVLTIWTPPRVGSALGPRILFPNSPSVVDKSVAFAEIAIQCSSVAAADVAIQCSSETCDSACQTSPRQTSPRLERDSNVQTSPRLSEPVTLLELKKELQALLSGICWL